jgi:hypothetical protein
MQQQYQQHAFHQAQIPVGFVDHMPEDEDMDTRASGQLQDC